MVNLIKLIRKRLFTMKYIFYNPELNTISNAPTIDFVSKSIHHDAIVAKDSEFNVPLGYEVATEQRSPDTKLVAVEPTANSVREFKTVGQLIKKQKDSVYYRQWLLAVALTDPPFNFPARCRAFLNN